MNFKRLRAMEKRISADLEPIFFAITRVLFISRCLFLSQNWRKIDRVYFFLQWKSPSISDKYDMQVEVINDSDNHAIAYPNIDDNLIL